MSVFDFDGVFTDGKIVFKDDKIVKSYNIKDGMGIKLLKENNIEVIILSGFKKNISQQNIADHLKIECYFGCKDKKKKIREICTEKNINLNEISYMGDDINDVELLRESKISACPSDAVDPRNLIWLKSNTNLVSMDITHCLQQPSQKMPDGTVKSGGIRELIPVMGKLAFSLGVNGIFMEVHDKPDESKCDAPTQWPFDKLEKFMNYVFEDKYKKNI